MKNSIAALIIGVCLITPAFCGIPIQMPEPGFAAEFLVTAGGFAGLVLWYRRKRSAKK
jgi:hypothetical protein